MSSTRSERTDAPDVSIGGRPSLEEIRAAATRLRLRAAGRGLARFTKIAQLFLRVFHSGIGPSLGDPVSVDVSMTEIAFRDAHGELRRILLPRQGEANERKLEALRGALEAEGQRALEA